MPENYQIGKYTLVTSPQKSYALPSLLLILHNTHESCKVYFLLQANLHTGSNWVQKMFSSRYRKTTCVYSALKLLVATQKVNLRIFSPVLPHEK